MSCSALQGLLRITTEAWLPPSVLMSALSCCHLLATFSMYLWDSLLLFQISDVLCILLLPLETSSHPPCCYPHFLAYFFLFRWNSSNISSKKTSFSSQARPITLLSLFAYLYYCKCNGFLTPRDLQLIPFHIWKWTFSVSSTKQCWWWKSQDILTQLLEYKDFILFSDCTQQSLGFFWVIAQNFLSKF